MTRLLLLSVLLAPLALTGCGGAREALGLGRVQPDEFAVVDRPPLAIPPDFTLKPPSPGTPRPQEIDMTRRAEQVVFNSDTAGGKGEPGSAEQALLQQAGADKVEPDIRKTIDREAQDLVVSNRRYIDYLLWWRKDQESPAAVVDAPAELERLKDNKNEGKDAVEGATPMIERSKSGFLGL